MEGDAASESDDCHPADAQLAKYDQLLAGLHPATVAQVAQDILRVHSAAGTDVLAQALFAAAVAEPDVTPLAAANLLVLLVERLPPGHRRDAAYAPELAASVVQRCHAALRGVETEAPQDTAHGCVLFLAELFKRQFVGTGEVKALFAKLVFGDDRPLDHAAALACHLFLSTGPFLERSALGRRLADLVCARLKELKGHNFSEATLFSLGHVTELRLNKWVPKAQKRTEKPKEKPKEKVEPRAEVRAGEALLASPVPAPPGPESREDKVLRIGQLFAQRRVALGVVRALFEALLPAQAYLACGLLRAAGPTLDGSEAGAALVAAVLARLEELRREPEVDAMVSEVAGLRARAWSPALRTYRFAVVEPVRT